MPRKAEKPRRKTGRTGPRAHPIFGLISSGDADEIRRMLYLAPDAVFAQDPNQARTTVHAATLLPGNSRVVEMLLKSPFVNTVNRRNWLMNARARNGKAPVHAAAERLDQDVLAVLSRYGADFTSALASGRDAFDLVYDVKPSGKNREAMRAECMRIISLRLLKPKPLPSVLEIPYQVARGLMTLQLYAAEYEEQTHVLAEEGLALGALSTHAVESPASPTAINLQQPEESWGRGEWMYTQRIASASERFVKSYNLLKDASKLHGVPNMTFGVFGLEADREALSSLLCSGAHVPLVPAHADDFIVKIADVE